MQICSDLIDSGSLSSYFFNGKEKDYESGFLYYGARYYNSELSTWLSTDPMADKYQSLSPYNYCANNPVKLIDPNGMEIWIIGEDGTSYKYKKSKIYTKDNSVYTGEDYDATNIDSLQTIYGCDSVVTTKTHYHYTAGIEDVANKDAISIYPNPAKESVTIEGKGEIIITNSLGQVVKEIKDNNDVRTLNIKNFESGVYYIKIGNTTQKLVVE